MMKLLVVLLSSVLVESALLRSQSVSTKSTCTCTDYYSTRIARVYHGDDAFPGDFPWQVSIQEYNKYGTHKWDHICGGTLLSDSHVLTAKHCLGLPASDYRVIVGTVYRNDAQPDNTYNVSHYEFYPKLDRVMFEHDVAVLMIQKSDIGESIKCSDRVKPVCLGDLATKGDTSCYISGWGQTETKPVSDTLQYAKVTVQPQATCSKIWNNRTEISFDRYTSSMMCAGPLHGGVDTCLGDSGGPLICLNENNRLAYLMGIVSWSTACGKRPSVYARVSEHLPWIREQIKRLN